MVDGFLCWMLLGRLKRGRFIRIWGRVWHIANSALHWAATSVSRVPFGYAKIDAGAFRPNISGLFLRRGRVMLLNGYFGYS